MIHDAFVLSDVGCVREHNEDDCAILPEHQVYAVADGMGGHSSGEVASRLSVQAVESVYGDPDRVKDLRKDYSKQRARGRLDHISSFSQYQLVRGVEIANEVIFDSATRDAALGDMGTTIVAMAFAASRVYVAFVGDSRAYLHRDGNTSQLTEDHSLANDLIRMKALKKEDLSTFPYKNVIVRALGLQQDVVVDSFYKNCRPGDRYVLCSDGLSDLVESETIGRILNATPGSEAAAEALVEAAMDAGGVDNITVLVVGLVG